MGDVKVMFPCAPNHLWGALNSVVNINVHLREDDLLMVN